MADIPEGIEAIGVTRRELDITDADAVAAVLDRFAPAWVINAAGYTAVDRAESEEGLARAGNALGPERLAEAAKSRGIQLAHLSTDFVFDGTCARPYAPGDPPNPQNAYGRTKLEGERLVAAAAPHALIVRTSWVYAAQGHNFVRTMLRLMAERDRIQVVNDQVGSPTSADSLAASVWALAVQGASGIFHFADGGVASWYDFAVAIQEEALARGLLSRAVPIWPIPAREYPTPARRPAFSVLDTGETYRRLGWPASHWRTNLRRTMDRMTEH